MKTASVTKNESTVRTPKRGRDAEIMIKHLFSAMNEAVDELIERFPIAEGEEKRELQHKITVLAQMSDTFVEEWVSFEEKMSKLRTYAFSSPEEQLAEVPIDTALSKSDKEIFQKGQGYFTLFMYDQAIRIFEEVIAGHPDFLLARMYLALGYLRIGKVEDALRHFQLLLPLTDNFKLKAISYNALGCIHVRKNNVEKAVEYFHLAFEADPGYMDSFLQNQ